MVEKLEYISINVWFFKCPKHIKCLINVTNFKKYKNFNEKITECCLKLSKILRDINFQYFTYVYKKW